MKDETIIKGLKNGTDRVYNHIINTYVVRDDLFKYYREANREECILTIIINLTLSIKAASKDDVEGYSSKKNVLEELQKVGFHQIFKRELSLYIDNLQKQESRLAKRIGSFNEYKGEIADEKTKEIEPVDVLMIALNLVKKGVLSEILNDIEAIENKDTTYDKLMLKYNKPNKNSTIKFFHDERKKARNKAIQIIKKGLENIGVREPCKTIILEILSTKNPRIPKQSGSIKKKRMASTFLFESYAKLGKILNSRFSYNYWSASKVEDEYLGCWHQHKLSLYQNLKAC